MTGVLGFYVRHRTDEGPRQSNMACKEITMTSGINSEAFPDTAQLRLTWEI